MEVLFILALVVGVALGVGLTTWCLSRQSAEESTWVVDAATDLSELEKSLNHLSEEGFGIYLVLSPQPETGSPGFVIIGRRAEYPLPGRGRI